MRLTVCGLELRAGQSQPVIFTGAVGVNDPASQYGESLFDVINGNVVVVKPLTARVCTGKLF